MVAPRKPLISRTSALLALATGNRQVQPAKPPMLDKLGVSAAAPNRNQAEVPQPADQTGKGDIRQAAYVYFTKVPANGEQTPLLYSADRMWAKVTVTLETAGPVAVGFSTDLLPLTSGKGILLTTNLPVSFDVAKGNKLYIQAAGINRVNVQVQAYPWLEQVTGLLLNIARTIRAAVGMK